MAIRNGQLLTLFLHLSALRHRQGRYSEYNAVSEAAERFPDVNIAPRSAGLLPDPGNQKVRIRPALGVQRKDRVGITVGRKIQVVYSVLVGGD